MKAISLVCLLGATLAVAHLPLAAAETARLRYVASIYFDDKGAGLNSPEGVACDGSGRVVVADTGNDRLLRFTYRDKTVAGGSEIRVPQLSAPSTIQLNSKGEIYVVDSRQRRIVRFSPEGEFTAAIGFDGVPVPRTVLAKSLAIDAADTIYVLDAFDARVLVMSAQAEFQKTLALPEDVGFATALSVDPAGALLILDSKRRRIFTAAKDASSFSPLGGDLTNVIATLPTSIAAAKGVIFVSEGPGSTIVGFGRDGSFLSRQFTTGWNEGSLNHPAQMCINDKDEVFVADRDNSRIQVFQLIR